MLELLVGPVSNILDKFIEDKDQKAKLAHEIATMAQENTNMVLMIMNDGGGVSSAASSFLISRMIEL